MLRAGLTIVHVFIQCSHKKVAIIQCGCPDREPTQHIIGHIGTIFTGHARKLNKTLKSNTAEQNKAEILLCHNTDLVLHRDVPDIWFRFRLAGYPAIFGYPVPVPAKISAIFVPTVSHIDYYKLLFNNLSSSDK